MFEEVCPSTLIPFRMADKWSPLVIRCLEDGPRRFSELQVPIRASAKALTTSLRRLERDGFVSRTIEDRSTRYALTTLGQSLGKQLDSWCEWASDHWDELLDARDPAV